MKTTRQPRSLRPTPAPTTTSAPARELAALSVRLADAEETLRAIRTGEVDTVMVAGKEGSQVFTLDGAEHAYRVLIESMNEGALTLTADAMILYANQCFARMIQLPLEQVTSSSFHRFLSPADQVAVRPLLKRAAKSGTKIQILLHAGDGTQLPVHISMRPVATAGSASVTIGMVVTDMTEARRSEERLRALSQRLVDLQETERRHVAVELHENISQLTYAILMRCDILAGKLPVRAHAARTELLKLCDLLNQTTEDVRRIARDLRPMALDDLGLLPVLRMACKQFGERAHVQCDLKGVQQISRLPAAVEMALYRILQEVLKNIAQHAQARHITVSLRQERGLVRLVVTDDGIGFDSNRLPAEQKRKGCFGLLSMRERATAVGGTLQVKSARGQGTSIQARIPHPLITDN